MKKGRGQGEEDIRGQPPSYIASHGEKSKERYTEMERDTSPMAKESRDNLSLKKKNWQDTSQAKAYS